MCLCSEAPPSTYTCGVSMHEKSFIAWSHGLAANLQEGCTDTDSVSVNAGMVGILIRNTLNCYRLLQYQYRWSNCNNHATERATQTQENKARAKALFPQCEQRQSHTVSGRRWNSRTSSNWNSGKAGAENRKEGDRALWLDYRDINRRYCGIGTCVWYVVYEQLDLLRIC